MKKLTPWLITLGVPVMVLFIVRLDIWNGPCNPLAIFAWTFFEPLMFLLFLIMPIGWAILPFAALHQVARADNKDYRISPLWYAWIGQAFFIYLLDATSRQWPIYASPFCP